MKKRTKRYRVQRSAPQATWFRKIHGNGRILRRGERPRSANVTLCGDFAIHRGLARRRRATGTWARAARPTGSVRAKSRESRDGASPRLFPRSFGVGSPGGRRGEARRHPPSLVPARMRETAAIATDRRVPRRVEETAVLFTRDSVSADPRRCPVASPPPRVADRASPAHPLRANISRTPRATRRPSLFLFSPPLSTDLSRSPSRRATSAWPSGWSSPRVYRRPSGARSCFAPATPTRRSSRARSA